MYSIRRIPLFGLLLALQACSSVESEDLRTGAFHYNYRATAHSEQSVSVNADFDVGDGLVATEIQLSGGDYVRAGIGGRSQRLQENHTPILNTYSYRTQFTNLASTSGEAVRVTLHRAGEGEYTTSIALPPRKAVASSRPCSRAG